MHRCTGGAGRSPTARSQGPWLEVQKKKKGKSLRGEEKQCQRIGENRTAVEPLAWRKRNPNPPPGGASREKKKTLKWQITLAAATSTKSWVAQRDRRDEGRGKSGTITGERKERRTVSNMDEPIKSSGKNRAAHTRAWIERLSREGGSKEKEKQLTTSPFLPPFSGRNGENSLKALPWLRWPTPPRAERRKKGRQGKDFIERTKGNDTTSQEGTGLESASWAPRCSEGRGPEFNRSSGMTKPGMGGRGRVTDETRKRKGGKGKKSTLLPPAER